MRLDKFLAESRIGTRKIVRNYVKESKIKVNGKVVIEPAMDIDINNDIVEYDERLVEHKGKVYYMFHKPGGCITARKDDVNKTVFDYFENVDMDGVFHVGRLDKDTEGLLLFTNDGDFNNRLMSPDKHVKKKYYFIALGDVEEEDKRKIENGLYIGNNEPITLPAEITISNSGFYQNLENELNLREYYDVNSNFYNQNITAGYLTISEGRKHQVKRMLKSVGCYVIYLKREAIGDLSLDDSLEKGQFRELTQDEINNFYL